MEILIINGPNLNLLGKREPSVYGSTSFDDYFSELQANFEGRCRLSYFQSNHEGDLIDKIHEVGFSYHGIIINAGGYSHTSIALHDAIKSVTTPAVEVHISNIQAREEFRHRSLVAAACRGSISGLGLDSYRLAIEHLIKKTK
ncbi:3-dehydroquinate dehydratase-2 [Dysgonomonas sp. PH5-45]|uniref:type II 3-dehydroquinate dehydratase n=1 Tax=unclassified Dysgonomonas TaxID=2630389 RepID=UPI002474FDB7|nr:MULTISPECIES: type II 3-dehydroquinate dehydratase [unclassified Dysgonomonas]MDH6354943.1 3-dehydroquinate dehydratase-2 [Dysgonomonas sp. PH5-45]MDH6387842.1 3-dehydroquinate dehydratase-2 [Dysgonomonas sp. PH5-37]